MALTNSDFACKCGCGSNQIKDEVVSLCNTIASQVGLPLTVNSGYRCPAHNAAVGGSSNSYHMQGLAADITCSNLEQLKSTCQTLHGSGQIGGYGIYSTFVHVDKGPHRSWTG